ncbi:MAG: tetratricopeptide repeat protein, partial [Chloroflexi bacterium]|nr:tetratricopeptide repeat protein [Chloroflexota bacterium]
WQNVPPRHRSVRAAFASSWQQLSEVERVAFANLSIFSGGFTQKAAQEITAATPETLQSLTIKSFLHYHPENGRYDIHQLLCQFGAEHLAQEPEQLTAVGDKHSRFMLHFMINANLVRDDKPDTQLWPKLRQEMKNIRSAWDWAIEREQFSLLNDCRPHLARYYNLRGPYAEAYLVFSQSIENLRAWLNAPHPEPLAGQQLLGNLLIEWTRFLKEKGLFEQITAVAQEIIALGQQCRSLSMQVSGYFYWGQALTNLRKFDTAQSKLQQGLTLANQANVPFPQAQILRQLGVLAYYGRDYDQAKTYYERALSLFRKLGNGREEAGVLNNLALVAYVHHDYKTAITIFQQAAQLYRQLGDYWGEGLALINMGNTCQQYGDYAGSRQFYEQSLPFKRRVGNRHGEGIAYVSLGLSCHRLGDYQASLRYNQQALEIAAELDDMDVRAFALTFMGHTLLTTDKLATAQEAYAEAYQIRLTRNQPQLAMEPLAGLAETLFLTGDLVQAMKWVELLYTSLSERGIAGTEEPYRLYHICFKILAANQDSRAALILEKAYADLIQCAREIPEPTIRHTFLENIAAHQAIISAHKEMKF